MSPYEKALSRNLPAKKYSVSNPTELRLSFEFEGSGTKFIDIAAAMSAINRKFVSQQAYFYVSKVELYNDEDAFVDIHTLPDTWVTKNAYKRARTLFVHQMDLLKPVVSGIAPAKYLDFKVYMNNRHRTTGSALPNVYDINSAATELELDEWNYSQIVSADDDGDANQQADNFYLHMLGGHNGSSDNWNSVGIIKSYAETRTTVPQFQGDETNLDITDPLLNAFDTSSEEQINDIATRLQQDNDSPPYDRDVYPGEGQHMSQQARLVTTTTLGRVATAPGFCAPLGLICVDPQQTATAYRIVLTLAPGTYHGCYAERV